MEQKRDTQSSATLSASLADVAALLRTNPAQAAAQATEILHAIPGQQQALLLAVGAYRAMGDAAGARTLLESLAKAQPKLAAVQYELGLLLGKLGETNEAIAALSRVVALEPNHPAAWRALGNQLSKARKNAAAGDAYARHLKTSVKELKLLEDAFNLPDDQLAITESVLLECLKINPTDVPVLHMLSKVGLRLGHQTDAASLLAGILELAPGFTAAREEYATLLAGILRWSEAIAQLDILLKEDPRNPRYRAQKASNLMMLGENERAMELYDALVSENRSEAPFWLNYGHSLRTAGRYDDCVAAYRKSIDLLPGLGAAWWGLANLKTFRFAPADIEMMRAQLARGDIAEDNRRYLHFALGKALEDRETYAESFGHYARGNELVRKTVHYDSSTTGEFTRRSKALFTPEFFHNRIGFGCPASDPIFIVGMPRSGSTLIEQILASHSAVEGTMELPDVIAIGERLDRTSWSGEQPGYPKILETLNGADFKLLGEEYLERTRVQRKLDRPFFTDKAPQNYQYIGLLQLMLPNARIIDARRHPIACSFSSFKQYYMSGTMNYCYNLADLGDFYRNYVELLAHFDTVLPGRIHRVFYEDMVREPEREVRRLLDHCGLPFEEACLRFYETERSVRTVSSEQVRQPIYTEAVEQWRYFEPWLNPLKEALGPVLTSYPDLPDFRIA